MAILIALKLLCGYLFYLRRSVSVRALAVPCGLSIFSKKIISICEGKSNQFFWGVFVGWHSIVPYSRKSK